MTVRAPILLSAMFLSSMALLEQRPRPAAQNGQHHGRERCTPERATRNAPAAGAAPAANNNMAAHGNPPASNNAPNQNHGGPVAVPASTSTPA